MMLALDFTRPPPQHLIDQAVRAALAEDLGQAGDITSQLTVAADATARAKLVARQPGTLAGLVLAEAAFRLMDANIAFKAQRADGATVKAGDVIATVEGNARAILAAERTALNFLGHLSGVASATAALVAEVAGTKARITCTRKTLPGLRAFQKYAVRSGGGFNHRFGLDDAILIKDNHIAAAGSVTAALQKARGAASHMMKVEIEVDNLAQLEEALSAGADIVLLDNMDVETLTRAVAIAKGRTVLEASGNVSLKTVGAIARTGVDMISSGAITHSAVNLDIGLDF